MFAYFAAVQEASSCHNSSCSDFLRLLICQDLSALQCEVCVLVFSVTDRRSFHRTAQLRLLLRETQPHTPIILVGNKSDLVRTREVTCQGKRRSAPFLSSLICCLSSFTAGVGLSSQC